MNKNIKRTAFIWKINLLWHYNGCKVHLGYARPILRRSSLYPSILILATTLQTTIIHCISEFCTLWSRDAPKFRPLKIIFRFLAESEKRLKIYGVLHRQAVFNGFAGFFTAWCDAPLNILLYECAFHWVAQGPCVLKSVVIFNKSVVILLACIY